MFFNKKIIYDTYKNKIKLTRKQINLRNIKMIINFLDARQKEESTETMIDLFIYVLDDNLIWENEIDISKLDNDNKVKLQEYTYEEITELIKYFNDIKGLKENENRICIEINNNKYYSNYINIHNYISIINDMKDTEVLDIAEKYLYNIYDGIIDKKELYNIKVYDNIYWEIIIDDMCRLIYNEITKIHNIDTVINVIEDEHITINAEEWGLGHTEYEQSIYNIMLENYNKLPEEINKSEAYDILNLVNELNRKSIKTKIEDYLEKGKGAENYAYLEGGLKHQILKEIEKQKNNIGDDL